MFGGICSFWGRSGDRSGDIIPNTCCFFCSVANRWIRYADSSGFADAGIPSYPQLVKLLALFLAAITATASAQIPAGVTEREITFPTDGLKAPGTLTIPQSKSKLPILLLRGLTEVNSLPRSH